MSLPAASAGADTKSGTSHRSLVLILTLLGVAAVTAAAFALRLHYVQNTDLFTDEFTTLWAARQVQQFGATQMPSGVAYTRGAFLLYVIAGLGTLGGLTKFTGRLPSLALGTLSVPLVWLVAWRLWNARVAWIAAVSMALLPEFILYSGRARFYAPATFMVMLMQWCAFAAARADQERTPGSAEVWRYHLGWAALYLITLFTLEHAILMIPALALGFLIWHGWRYFFRPAVFAAFLVAVAGTLSRAAYELIGQPGMTADMQEAKPYLLPFIYAAESWSHIGEAFVSPPRLVWTVFFLFAVVVSTLALVRVRGRFAHLRRYDQASIFYALQAAVPVAIIVLLMSPSWSAPRYALLTQPAWLLVSAAGFVWLVERVFARSLLRNLVTAAAVALIVWSLADKALRITNQDAEGYEPVLRAVVAMREPGDVLMSPQPPACAWMNGGPCDYYVVGREDDNPYLVERDGKWIDRWSGAEVIATPEELAAVIKSGRKIWFVVDGERLGRRYRPEMLEIFEREFDLEFREKGVNALVAEGWNGEPDFTARHTIDPAIQLGPFDLTSLQHTTPSAGEFMILQLTWQQNQPSKAMVSTSISLVSADGTRLTQSDGMPMGGAVRTEDNPDKPLPDLRHMMMPESLPEGWYRFEAVTYDTVTGEYLSEPTPVGWLQMGPEPSAPEVAFDAAWKGGLTLVGMDALPEPVQQRAMLGMRLVWQASEQPAADYTTYVHLIDADGNLVAQDDHAPLAGFYPTSKWQAGTTIDERYQLALPADLAPGEYTAVIGLYTTDGQQPVALADGEAWLEVGSVQVE